MVKAIKRAAYIMDVVCDPDNIEENAHGNLSKAMNMLDLLKGNLKKTCESGVDDYEFQFFHSLGKFLYNKRNQNLGVDSNGVIRMMKSTELQNIKNKPLLYFNPEDIINRAPCEPYFFWLYLEENFLDFYGDIHDASHSLEYFSLAD